MKTIISTTQRFAVYAFLMFLLPVATIWANEEDSFNDDTEDMAQLPINDFVIPTMIIALVAAFYLYQKQTKNQML